MSPYPASEYSDWESEADRETETEAEAVTPTQRTGASLTMEELQEQARFVSSGDDVTINLIPAFSAYLLGVAGKVNSIQSCG